ncbi:DUF397 domain-containing protein [Streptomyces sp. RS10V-4]|uniref:DUF397 domain-containing protein n=1 Tax=Streptomyces rhizoryzae TaxID=2932493 RepID=UPI002005807F|nr:DUF397 domain-containing protein [Streptomyces rhizoryzae]MCK7627858.1 DUF397 domain-containing protein [Streptomyces rhizoryzae]
MRDHDLSTANWRKSTYSGHNNDDCLEVSDSLPGLVPVRDSKDPEGPALVFPADGWTSFIGAVKSGQLTTG